MEILKVQDDFPVEPGCGVEACLIIVEKEVEILPKVLKDPRSQAVFELLVEMVVVVIVYHYCFDP
jgi:hypothetical protein